MSDRRTGLVVPMPELEPLVGAHRLEWDPVAEHGARAHVTVLFPFAHAEDLDAALLGRVRAAVARLHAFPVTFARVERFPDDVLYLAPEPSAPFRALTAALAAAFPEFPPYGGLFPEVVPHLTVAHHPHAPVADITTELDALLPVRATAASVELWVEGADALWTTGATFPLAGAAG